MKGFPSLFSRPLSDLRFFSYRNDQCIDKDHLQPHTGNRLNFDRYNVTAVSYDILDLPWERQYRKWRPELIGDIHGAVLKAGDRQNPPLLEVTSTRFLKHDVYLLIEGMRGTHISGVCLPLKAAQNVHSKAA